MFWRYFAFSLTVAALLLPAPSRAVPEVEGFLTEDG